MAQPPRRRTVKTGKTTPPTQGSKAGKPKKTSHRTPKKNPTDKWQGQKKIKLIKIIEEPIFYVYNAHKPSGNLDFSHFHPTNKNCFAPLQNQGPP